MGWGTKLKDGQPPIKANLFVSVDAHCPAAFRKYGSDKNFVKIFPCEQTGSKPNVTVLGKPGTAPGL